MRKSASLRAAALSALLFTFCGAVSYAGEPFARLERALAHVPEGYMPVYILPVQAGMGASEADWEAEVLLGKDEKYAFVFEVDHRDKRQAFRLVNERGPIFSGTLDRRESSPTLESAFYQCRHSGRHRLTLPGVLDSRSGVVGYALVCVQREKCPAAVKKLASELNRLSHLLTEEDLEAASKQTRSVPIRENYPPEYNATALLVLFGLIVSLWTWGWWRNRR